MAHNEEYIENLEQLDDYYNGNYDWDEILENFKLNESFIRQNFDKLDKTLLLQNQDLSINFIFDYIKSFDVEDVISIKEIKDEDLINKLKEYKSKSIQPETKFEIQEVIEKIDLSEDVVSKVENLSIESKIENLVSKETDTKVFSNVSNKVDIEQLSIDRLRELHVPYNSIMGIHLSKVYITKYKELENKYKNSIQNFDDLILESLNAK